MPRTAHPHLENTLRDLRDRYGAGACALTADEMFDLVRCVERVERPFGDVNADAVGFPVRVCEGVHFWRLTAGASAWLDEFAGAWWGGERDEKRYFWALCYALAHARDREAFAGLDTPSRAYEAIRRFVLKCPATEKELSLAVDRVLGRAVDADDPRRGGGDVRDGAVDWSRLVMRLETQSGVRADEWLWGRSAGYLVRAYNDLRAFAIRYGAAQGEGAGRMTDLLDDALNALARCKARISRRLSAERDAARREEEALEAMEAEAADGGSADAGAEGEKDATEAKSNG